VGTAFTLHIEAQTMQLAPDLPIVPYRAAAKKPAPRAAPSREPAPSGEELEVDEELYAEMLAELGLDETNTYARIGITTLLWGD